MTDLREVGPTHVCVSCKAVIEDERRWEGHTDTCMQPEIRMRRAEQSIANNHVALLELTEFVRNMFEANAQLNANVELHQKTIEELQKERDRLSTELDHVRGFLVL